jgi:pimeloyl-ACP methyl ester carboxylesterase
MPRAAFAPARNGVGLAVFASCLMAASGFAQPVMEPAEAVEPEGRAEVTAEGEAAGEAPTVEEVTFTSVEDGVTLAGTLMIPSGEGPFPAVVFVSGSGPQDRDSVVFRQPIFRNLAEALTATGFITLRFDDRGVGQSTGDHASATTTDFAEDAEGALRFLGQHPMVERNGVALVGHSEGGIVGLRLAAAGKVPGALVLMATPAALGADLLADQQRQLLLAAGTDPGVTEDVVTKQRALIDLVQSRAEDDVIREAATELVTAQYASQFDQPPPADIMARAIPQAMQQATSPWVREFASFDTRPTIAKIPVATLALYGGVDLQVSDDLNAIAMTDGLKKIGHPASRVVVFPRKNHLFQNAETGLIGEYARAGMAPAPEVIEAIAQWLESGMIPPDKRRR